MEIGGHVHGQGRTSVQFLKSTSEIPIIGRFSKRTQANQFQR